MADVVDRLAAALRSVDEFCQSGLNSGTASHMEAALIDAIGAAREALSGLESVEQTPMPEMIPVRSLGGKILWPKRIR